MKTATASMTRDEANLEIATIKADPDKFFRRMESFGPEGRLARAYWDRLHQLAAPEDA